MRLVTCLYESIPHLGVVVNESVWLPALNGMIDPENNSMLELIDAGNSLLEKFREATANVNQAECIPLQQVELLAPIPRPRQNVMCLGWNYADHAKETAHAINREVQVPDHPIVFTKSASSMNGPFADIPYDASVSDRIDWEVELGVIIGKSGKQIPVEQALDHVFGYSVINDISARDMQRRHKQFFLGKSLTGSCPMGPWIVTSDEIPDPQSLDLRSRVNGELKQESNTCLQIFNVATTISILSRGMQLEAGDIIATGTPSGVGFARNPPEFLRPGDVVECEVERIGCLRNRITQ